MAAYLYLSAIRMLWHPLNIQNLNKAFPEYETNSLKNKSEITSATCIKENTKGHLTYYSVSDPVFD
ncbi:hypothetical protein AIS22_13500 [Salmonella enterica]|nr:hypothetical protein [Salmonella enterica]EAX3553158.1 hypothetical protein [Salmonella enterica]EAX3562564.1 hypothetical protein [Salmonella enterica]EAY7925617.1 hypothetical protein [Salmonella enterica]